MGQHTLMQYAGDKNALRHSAEEDHMFRQFPPIQALPNVVAATSWRRAARESVAASFNLVEITRRLFLTPGPNCVRRDPEQVLGRQL